MDSDDLLLIGALAAAGFLFYKLFVPAKVSDAEAKDYTIKAASERGLETWYAPLQGKQAILDSSGGRNVTYFLSGEDYNKMQRWERLAFQNPLYPLKKLFGVI